MRRVLIISYYFPPAGGPGVQRIMGMVRHLPAFGWQPSVLTVKDGTFFNVDKSGLAEIPPGIDVHRARSIEPHTLYNRLRGRSADETIPLGHTGAGRGLLSRFASTVRANVFVPDARIGWFPSAVRAATRLVREHQFDAILTSSPPQTVQLIGHATARKTGVPWLADFRDPWTRIYYYDELPRLQPVRHLDYALEQRCVRGAHAVTVVNGMVRDSLGLANDEARVVSNGFEERDFIGHVDPVLDRFELVYTGNLIASLGDTEPFFRVLSELAKDSAFREALSLVFVGRIHDRAIDELRRYDLESLSTFTGFISHSEAVKRLRAATVALFIGPGDILGAKIYEYVATGRPILALAPPGGDVDRLLAETTGDSVIDHRDAGGIRERIVTLYESWRNGTLPSRRPMEGVEHLTRSEQTRQIADTLNGIVT